MINLTVALNNGVNLNMGGTDANTEDILKSLNAHEALLFNFGGNIIGKHAIIAIVPETESTELVELTLTNGRKFELESATYDAAQVMSDAHSTKEFIEVAGAIVNKRLINTILPVANNK